MKNSLLICFCISFLLSCNHYERMDPKSQSFLGSNAGVFRGLDFDVSPEAVIAHEWGEMLDKETDYLHFIDRPHGAGANDYLDIQYFFNGAGELDMITAFYALDKIETLRIIERDVFEYFTRKYGQSTTDDIGWHVWEYNTRQGHKGLVELSMRANTNEGFRGIELEAVKYIQHQ